MNITDILNQTNPDDIRFLLQQYNITEEPSEESVAKAIQIYGDDFITDLYILLYYSANNDGDKPSDVADNAQKAMFNFFNPALNKTIQGTKYYSEITEKPTFWNKFRIGIKDFSDSLKEGVKNYGASKQAFANNGNPPIVEQPEDNIWKWALGIGGALILILVFIILLKRKPA
ncbi:MAG: hypothetical protein BWY27_01114 [Bacteroidetes bacterium ADurb.Bin234]|nr:MAG: hypothetical protein BWY27_01114 [Bacteroidetes bacterium ADurb.Bin234]